MITSIEFPKFTGIRCLMLPYIQGNPASVPERFRNGYEAIIENVVVRRGDIGFLTIDESPVAAGAPHRGARAKWGRAIHTEAGVTPSGQYKWGSTSTWGGRANVTLSTDVKVLLANNLDDSCAIWPAIHADTSDDGDIGDKADSYPYSDAIMMKAGEVHMIGILTPHESLPVRAAFNRQFLRIVSSGVTGREPYFTENELMR